ncbi:MAG: hypothetical protein IT453_20050 [Planctomycetes bacterium]|nr:hypothetical protein [Planctomycetota bacterium]
MSELELKRAPALPIVLGLLLTADGRQAFGPIRDDSKPEPCRDRQFYRRVERRRRRAKESKQARRRNRR